MPQPTGWRLLILPYKGKAVTKGGIVLAKETVQRESLATASRLGQFFHWVLASKHPLFLFGIPGIVMLYFGFKMTTELVTKFDSIDSVSLGVALATATITFVGLFASMAAIVLYILGKQIDKIQMQYQDF